MYLAGHNCSPNWGDWNQIKWHNKSNETGGFGEREKQESSEKNLLEQSREAP